MRSIYNNETFRWTITSPDPAWDPPHVRVGKAWTTDTSARDHPSSFVLAGVKERANPDHFSLKRSVCAPAPDQSFRIRPSEQQIIPPRWLSLLRNKGSNRCHAHASGDYPGF
jgi:hypothetical protein